ncbi:MAG: crossover junction endodeoxyribonuclease RuvC [Clostridia bacterium]|nr:crossover junction endodeoxyribonuclease RuvC [Clostridia bacterium]
MVILGVDPGYAIVGWGAVSYEHGRYQPLCFGAITTPAHTPFNARLLQIYRDTKLILDKVKPQALAIEKLYFTNNKTTAVQVCEARGVILLAAEEAGVEVFEYTPLQVKSAVTGYGQAEKPQVMEMTRRLLKLKETPRPDDTADALAIAICHAQSGGTAVKRRLIQTDL